MSGSIIGLNLISPATLLTQDDSALERLLGKAAWGIYSQNGYPVLEVDSVADVDYSRDYDLSYYPQEQGSFETYNKVQKPFQAKLGFLINQTRVSFLQSVEAAVASLELVTVVTPEVSYPSANLLHYGYRREQKRGVTMIRVEVWCEEIRLTAGTNLGQASAQNTGGTTYPIGQTNSNNLSGATQGYAIPTQSTSGASPFASGQVSPALPGSSNFSSPGIPFPPSLSAPT